MLFSCFKRLFEEWKANHEKFTLERASVEGELQHVEQALR